MFREIPHVACQESPGSFCAVVELSQVVERLRAFYEAHGGLGEADDLCALAIHCYIGEHHFLWIMTRERFLQLLQFCIEYKISKYPQLRMKCSELLFVVFHLDASESERLPRRYVALVFSK